MFDAAVLTDEWAEDPMGLLPDGGDVGGDIQIGKAFERTFARKLASGHFEVAVFYVYVARDEGETFVQTMAMHLYCTDVTAPGDTEYGSDVLYWRNDGSTENDSREICADLTLDDIDALTNEMGCG